MRRLLLVLVLAAAVLLPGAAGVLFDELGKRDAARPDGTYPCPVCHGLGWRPSWKGMKCWNCGGHGYQELFDGTDW